MPTAYTIHAGHAGTASTKVATTISSSASAAPARIGHPIDCGAHEEPADRPEHHAQCDAVRTPADESDHEPESRSEHDPDAGPRLPAVFVCNHGALRSVAVTVRCASPPGPRRAQPQP